MFLTAFLPHSLSIIVTKSFKFSGLLFPILRILYDTESTLLSEELLGGLFINFTSPQQHHQYK